MNNSSKAIAIIASVVAVHFLAGGLILLQPGCKSNAPKTPPPPAAAADVTAVPVTAGLHAPTRPDTTVTPVTPIPVGRVSAEPLAVDNTAVNPPPASTVPAGPTITYVVKARDNPATIARETGVSVNALLAANNMKPGVVLRPGQELKIPARAASASPAAVSTPIPAGAKTYTVASGDTLGTIARKNGTTAAAIRSANNLPNDTIRVTQKLIIPQGSGAAASAAPTATPPPAAAASSGSAEGGVYVVQSGDSLETIAKKHGVKTADLMKLNNITNPNRMQVGTKLKLPAGATGSTAATTTPTPSPATSAPLFPPSAPSNSTTAPAAPASPDSPPVVPVTGIN